MIDITLAHTLHGAGGSWQLSIETRIASGSFAALFGPSGAGKTTILRMLAGLARPASGRIVVDDTIWFDSAAGINLPPQKRSIGFLFQDYALFPNLSVRGNIAYALDRRDDAWVDELLALTGLTQLAARLPATLSGGQKQRVALARAVARRPRLLLLDEPLSALDMRLRAELQDELAALHRRFGLTTLLVSHDIGEVFKLAQHVMQLEAGRILASGSPAEVFLQNRLSGQLNLRAQVLAVRQEEVVHIVTLLVGQEILEVLVSDDEAALLKPGDHVAMSAKTLSPYLFKVD
ncbi:ABC transporter ATP-binding protein [Noviherbaspirillum saxi]|uniref:ATP-binding cassette domain-containing protein n=1 Tax=Noviherbaspirillum saxi TaxID=2320863 RepID=A0A3A3FI34_9BURK|nr:ATP-binding cassette domain-containing protein [Noviherbaspirillum saxi]RJF95168.1 ATP-binding cassette domain-containing protein [Noviherbaspirillum saxi]